jgi:DNA-binding response OmpR family regulator
MKILLIEEDRLIARELSRAFAGTGVRVDWVQDASEGKEALTGSPYAFIILDLGLPPMSSKDVLKTIQRMDNRPPVLTLTQNNDPSVRIAALRAGADDVLVKPLDFDELKARARAILRRYAGHATSHMETSQIGLDIASREATYNGTTRQLTAREFALLYALMERPGAVLSRAQLEDRLYAWGEEVESNAVDVIIYYLRQRFDKDVIKNIRGMGWRVNR